MDAYFTIAAPSEGEFKDRGSKFLGFAFPVQSETAAMAQIEMLRKTHFKARHHCFAWRIGTDGNRFRANDDGEPSGTAGRPILGQIDAFQVRDVAVVVVRYFGGVLLGASGLINAYRESAAEALRAATLKEVIVKDHFSIHAAYSLIPDLIGAIKKLNIELLNEIYAEEADLEIAIRLSESADKCLRLKAMLYKVSLEEAQTLDWPAGMTFETITV